MLCSRPTRLETLTLHHGSHANRVLARLAQGGLRSLENDLEPIELPVRMQLERAHQAVLHVYFLETGFASVVTNGLADRSIEVGLIGSEGMTGLAVVLAAEHSPQETFMQAAGHGHRILSVTLRKRSDECVELRRCLLQSVHIFGVQSAQTCLANGRGKLEERLARWLLMAHDRIEGDQLRLTQDFLSVMLGVRRPGVTIAVQNLDNRGLIKAQRGLITIIDRKGLELATNGFYGVAEGELTRLFG